MQLSSTSIAHGARIDQDFAFCTATPDGAARTAHGRNRNPHVAWSGAPEGTRSFAVVMHDPDVPADASNANTEGETIPADAERTDFFHWLLVDVSADLSEIAEGALADGVVDRGREPGRVTHGIEGTNDFTDFLKGSPVEGTYGGYDGPCPPWNDQAVHHYHLTVYALDVETLGLSEDGDFRGADVLDAIEGHVLDQAEIVGTYTTNPDVA